MRVIMSKKTNKWAITKWGGRHTRKATTWVFDDWGDSYDLLPTWLERMVQCYLKSTYKLEIDDIVLNNQLDNCFCKFQHVFWSFKQLVMPSNIYRGTLLIATIQDENMLSHIFGQHSIPVTQKQEIYLISNRHNAKLKKELINLGYTTYQHHFEEKLIDFMNITQRCNIGLMTSQKKNGVLHMMMKAQIWTYDHELVRLCEQILKRCKKSTNYCIEYFVQRRAKARSKLGSGQMYYKKLMEAIKKLSKGLHSSKTFNPCEYGAFQTFRYPCSHVIAACAHSMIRDKRRSKSTHIRNEIDWRELQCRQKCGYCKCEGHNRSNYLCILEEHDLP
ncbi:hypothetical protein CR513_43814, partial [Mucuna pruriens]